MNATTYGLDIAKAVIKLYWVDGETGEIGSRTLKRPQLAPFFANRSAGRIVIEACGSAHHWARTVGALGEELRLVHARHVSVGTLSKCGDPFVRTLLVHAARSVIHHAKDKSTWLE